MGNTKGEVCLALLLMKWALNGFLLAKLLSQDFPEYFYKAMSVIDLGTIFNR